MTVSSPSGKLRHARRAGDRIGKRLRQVLNERQIAAGDANHVARLQNVVAANLPLANKGAVAAVQIAERPGAARDKNLGVLAARLVRP